MKGNQSLSAEALNILRRSPVFSAAIAPIDPPCSR